jgi:agmatinase
MSHLSVARHVASGQQPFFGTPPVEVGVAGIEVDVVMFGVPYDGGTTSRPGARFGPYHVRRMSALVERSHLGHRVDVFETVHVVDGGNAMTPPFHPGAMRDVVEGFTSAVLDMGAVPFAVGGDHSVTLPILRSLAKRHGPLALVHVDAHADTSHDSMSNERFRHGTPIRQAIDEGLVAPGKLFQIGLRGAGHSGDGQRLGDDFGARRVSADAVADLGAPGIAREICSSIGGRPTYLSFDIDAVDPAFAPATGTPVPGGLSSREALAFVRGLAGVDLVGMDLVEVCPEIDRADITSLLAAHLLWEGLTVVAQARRPDRG